MRIEQTFSVPQPEALARLTALGEYFTNKHGIRVTWDGEKAKFEGSVMAITIQGALTFVAGKALFEGKDPPFFVKRKAEEYIAHKIRSYLDPTRKVEELPRR